MKHLNIQFAIAGEGADDLTGSTLVQALIDGLGKEWWDTCDGDDWAVYAMTAFDDNCQDRIDMYKRQNGYYKKRNVELITRGIDNQRIIDDLKATVASQEREIGHLDGLLAGCQKHNTEASGKALVYKRRIDALEARLADTAKELDRMDGIAYDRKKEIDQLQAHVAELASQLERCEQVSSARDELIKHLDGKIHDRLIEKDFWAREEFRYEQILKRLNMFVPTPNGQPWTLDHTGGGMTHAAWYGDEAKPAWVAIDDNDDGITIGGYVDEGLSEMVYVETVYGTDNIQDADLDTQMAIVEHAKEAIAAVTAHYYPQQ